MRYPDLREVMVGFAIFVRSSQIHCALRRSGDSAMPKQSLWLRGNPTSLRQSERSLRRMRVENALNCPQFPEPFRDFQ